MECEKSQEQKEGHQRVTENNNKVHFATLMVICHLKNAELEPKLQSTMAELCSMVTLYKTTLEPAQFFTEQGSSASQMTAAKVMDVSARLPACDGQAADALSAYTQEKLKDGPRLLKIPKSECPDVWIRLPKHKWLRSWEYIEDLVVPLERNLYGHPLAGLLWERQFEKALMELGWKEVPNWECLFVHRQQGHFLSVWLTSKWLEGGRIWHLCGRN